MGGEQQARDQAGPRAGEAMRQRRDQRTSERVQENIDRVQGPRGLTHLPLHPEGQRRQWPPEVVHRAGAIGVG